MELLTIILTTIVGLSSQFIDGLLGMGYGVTSSSFLLMIGVAPAMVSFSVHAAEIFASFASGVSHFKFGNVKKHIVIPLTVSGVLGGTIGAYFLASANADTIKPIVGIILLALGIRMFIRFFKKRDAIIEEGRFSKRFLLPLGFIGGLLDAMGGGGWGPVCTTALISKNKVMPKNVIGSVNLSEFFVTVAITTTFILTIGLDSLMWEITLPLLIGGIIAAPIAAYACKKVPIILLGVLVGSMLIITNTKTVLGSAVKAFDLVLPLATDTIVLALIGMLLVIIVWNYNRLKKEHQTN